MGALHQDQLIAISNSEAMKPWNIGGDYSRPIVRRILEEAGVPRGSFGIRKQAASVLLAEHRNMLSPSSSIDFKAWLDDHVAEFWQNGKVPPRLHDAVLAPAQWLARRGWAIHARAKSLPQSLQFVRAFSRSIAEWGDKERLNWFLFPWAIDRAKRAYASTHPITKPGPLESEHAPQPRHTPPSRTPSHSAA